MPTPSDIRPICHPAPISPDLPLPAARLGGFIFFGPHMYFVGRVVDKQRKTARDAAETYRWATAQGKQRILDDYRESLMKKAREQVIAC